MKCFEICTLIWCIVIYVEVVIIKKKQTSNSYFMMHVFYLISNKMYFD